MFKNGGGRVKVEFLKVDKHFWHVKLGQNWRLSLRLRDFDLGLKVDRFWHLALYVNMVSLVYIWERNKVDTKM